MILAQIDLHRDLTFAQADEMQQEALTRVSSGGEAEILFFELQKAVTAGMGISDQEIKSELLDPELKVSKIRRGGRLTVHGPGQLVVFPVLPIQRWQINLHDTLSLYQSWIITWLHKYSISGHLRPGLTGVWIKLEQEFRKISSIGIGMKKGVTQHGISINIEDTSNLFASIIPCGNAIDKTISLRELRQEIPSLEQIARELMETFTTMDLYAPSK